MPFDPNAPARVTRGRQRGSRWRLLAGVAVVVGCGAIVAQQWVPRSSAPTPPPPART